jgi:branched-chain amino acid transport system permease protein
MGTLKYKYRVNNCPSSINGKSMEKIIEQLLNGLTLGALYAMISIGLALIFGVVQLVNFAHGSIYIMGGYTFYIMNSIIKLNYWVAAIITVAIMVIFGVIFERILVKPILIKPWYVQMIATLAGSVVLTNLALRIWGPSNLQSTSKYTSSIIIFHGLRISQQRIIVIVGACLFFLLTNLFIQYTKPGKAMRAISQNRETCKIVGINLGSLSRLTFGLSAGLAGLAAATITPLYSISPNFGQSLILKAFAAIIIGGMGNMKGAFYASFILGVIEAFTVGYISSAYQDAIGYIAMLVFLFVWPFGLFGKKVGI